MDILLEEYSAPDQLFVRHAVSDAPDDRYYTMHVHSECEIYLFLGGRCDYLVEGSQLTRIVKDATGSPVWEYITAKRLALAREKMLSGMTALRIAEECGFGDYSSFYRAYVRHYGHSPRENSQTHTNRSAGS